MAKVEIPAEFMPAVEHPDDLSDVDMRLVVAGATIPVAVVLEAAEHIYAYVQTFGSAAHAESLYADAHHILGCDCGRSRTIQQLCQPDFPLLPCGHTLRLIALEALPQPVTVQCPHCQESFEVEV